jgi:hypothetical protein
MFKVQLNADFFIARWNLLKTTIYKKSAAVFSSYDEALEALKNIRKEYGTIMPDASIIQAECKLTMACRWGGKPRN